MEDAKAWRRCETVVDLRAELELGNVACFCSLQAGHLFFLDLPEVAFFKIPSSHVLIYCLSCCFLLARTDLNGPPDEILGPYKLDGTDTEDQTIILTSWLGLLTRDYHDGRR